MNSLHIHINDDVMILGLTRRDILTPSYDVLMASSGEENGKSDESLRRVLQGRLDAHVSPMYKGIQDSLGFWTQLFEGRLALARG